mgnify:FL=1
MTKAQAIEQLYAIGYLTVKRPGSRAFSTALKAFQEDSGIKADGKLGPQTRRALLDPLLGFCGVTEHIRTHDGLCKWPTGAITWTITGSLAPRISAADQKAAFTEAWRYWSAVCNITPKYVANSKTANVLMGAGPIDGAGNTLAWSHLPCGTALQLEQKYGTAETWVISENPRRVEIDLVRVAAHEIGHVLGIPHLSDSGALLAPMYNPLVRGPQKSDIAEAVKRYGPPKEPPTTTPTGDWIDLGMGFKMRSPSLGGGKVELNW